jgi:RNA 2',3'-cyclic 3'-phosphodiesterase
MPAEIRTFIAVELEPATREALGDLQTQLKAHRAGRFVRWVAPDGIHLTLKFLGGVDPDRISALTRAVAEACSEPRFSLTLAGLGAFPNTRRPNVVWVGVGGDVESAVRLAEQVDRACVSLGWPPEARPFAPHLTLGRVKRDVRPSDQQLVGEMISSLQVEQLAQVRVERVSIMKSDLAPAGSVYTQMATIELGVPQA